MPVLAYLSKLSHIAKNDVTLVIKVKDIDTIDFVLKIKYQWDKAKLENTVPDVTDLVKITKTHWITK